MKSHNINFVRSDERLVNAQFVVFTLCTDFQWLAPLHRCYKLFVILDLKFRGQMMCQGNNLEMLEEGVWKLHINLGASINGCELNSCRFNYTMIHVYCGAKQPNKLLFSAGWRRRKYRREISCSLIFNLWRIQWSSLFAYLRSLFHLVSFLLAESLICHMYFIRCYLNLTHSICDFNVFI